MNSDCSVSPPGGKFLLGEIFFDKFVDRIDRQPISVGRTLVVRETLDEAW